MKKWVVWIQGDAFLELLLSSGPIPLIERFDMTERRVSLGKRAINRQRLFSSFLRLGKRFVWRGKSEETEQRIGVCHTDISQSVVRVKSNRLLKIAQRFVKAVRRALVPKIAALQVGLVGLAVLRITFDEPPVSDRARQRPDGCPSNSFSDHIFDGEDIGKLFVKVVGPERCAITRAH